VLKRTIMVTALGVALIGGSARVTHASSVPARQAAAADLVLATVGGQTADTDASAPCIGAGTADEAGDCADSQNTAGPEDSTGAAETADAAEPAGAADTDTAKSGP
jgi:hypothetical protein